MLIPSSRAPRPLALLLMASMFAAPMLPAQTAGTQAKAEKSNTPTPSTPAGTIHTADDPDLLREVQLGIREKEYVGLVWWIPFEFWQISGAKRGIPEETTAHNMKALKDYTIVAVFAAKVSALGAFDFVSLDDLHRDVVLRDAAGNEYQYIPEPSQDAKNLAAIVKPILSSAMGKTGENFDMLFFPARGKGGEVIAEATHKGQFQVVLKNNMVGVPESVYQWHTPVTSIAPPKYCPVGKERVHADWDYCPWHGVALNSGAK